MLQTAPAENSSTLRAHYIIVDDFLPTDVAAAMRQDIEIHFGTPGSHRAETHQVWNYWFVPNLYTYLRTSPEKVIRREYVEQFMRSLEIWSGKNLGMNRVGYPYLSLYVDGCRQALHNDAKNGRFAFVYSLTRNERKTIGGETIVLHEGDPFRTKLKTPAAGRNFYTCIEPRFNRLVIFDDRIPHGVERVEGPMDPLEGRFVLHGHINEAGSIVEGALALDTVNKVFVDAMGPFFSRPRPYLSGYHGPLVYRFIIDRAGDVETCDVIVDRVIGPYDTSSEWDEFVASLISALKALKFPPAHGSTTVIQPILFGGPLQ
jgi:Rps23 Pro-64 3,4-dihydroxylase Tpa1-like proline 4-hydroxylase